MSWIGHQFKLAHEFYRDHIARRFLIALAGFLVLSAGCYFALRAMPEQAQRIFDQFSKLVKELGVSEDGSVSWLAILGNNARSAALSVAFGLLPFLFLPVVPLVVNAVVIGGVLAVVGAKGVSVTALIVRGLLPHGVFEIPAIMLAVAAGMWLCRNMCRTVLRRDGAVPLERALPALLRFYLCIVLPLLVVAALIEGFVTPLLLRGVTG